MLILCLIYLTLTHHARLSRKDILITENGIEKGGEGDFLFS